MPVTVVVGGQFGSEGKGKVAHWIAKKQSAAAAIRVGGSNSGHTVVDENGNTFKFRHLPTAAILPDVKCVIAAGSYIDVDVLLREVEECGIQDDRVIVDPGAVVVSEAQKRAEQELKSRIGSTGSGTGAAVADRVLRKGTLNFARDDNRLKDRFVLPSVEYLRSELAKGERVIIEGTQGFGLSLLHSAHYPKVTSRDTTAAAFVSECGLSPLDVDEVIMVLRAFPIRVSGDSGPLPNEINWETVSEESGAPLLLEERTTVTGNVRRVARFDGAVVKLAISANQPTCVVLNHADYFDYQCHQSQNLSTIALSSLQEVERIIHRKIDFVGTGPASLLPADSLNRIRLIA